MKHDIDYPALVLNRKFASNGEPYWKCELRFAADDVEMFDRKGSREDVVNALRESHDIVHATLCYDHHREQGGEHGQYIYHLKMGGSWTI